MVPWASPRSWISTCRGRSTYRSQKTRPSPNAASASRIAASMASALSPGSRTTRIPRPPPPAAALITSGNPISSGSPCGRTGTPASRAIRFAASLSPPRRSASGGGPTQVNPASSTAAANSGLSARKPYPGSTASAPEPSAAATTAAASRYDGTSATASASRGPGRPVVGRDGGDRLEAEAPAGAEDSYGDLSAVGDEDPAHGREAYAPPLRYPARCAGSPCRSARAPVPAAASASPVFLVSGRGWGQAWACPSTAPRATPRTDGDIRGSWPTTTRDEARAREAAGGARAPRRRREEGRPSPRGRVPGPWMRMAELLLRGRSCSGPKLRGLQTRSGSSRRQPAALNGTPYRGAFLVRHAAVGCRREPRHARALPPGRRPEGDAAPLASAGPARAGGRRAFVHARDLRPGKLSDLYDDQRSQVYSASGPRRPRRTSRSARRRTASSPTAADPTTYYHSTSGGRTENSRRLERGSARISAASPIRTTESRPHRWGPRRLDLRPLKIRGVRDLSLVRTRSGRVGEVVLQTTGGPHTIEADDLRRRLGLRSTWFLSVPCARRSRDGAARADRAARRRAGRGPAVIQRREGARLAPGRTRPPAGRRHLRGEGQGGEDGALPHRGAADARAGRSRSRELGRYVARIATTTSTIAATARIPTRTRFTSNAVRSDRDGPSAPLFRRPGDAVREQAREELVEADALALGRVGELRVELRGIRSRIRPLCRGPSSGSPPAAGPPMSRGHGPSVRRAARRHNACHRAGLPSSSSRLSVSSAPRRSRETWTCEIPRRRRSAPG